MKTIKLLVLVMSLCVGIALAQDNEEEIVENVHIGAEFLEGGLEGFRKQFAANLDVEAVDEEAHLTKGQIEERMEKIKKKKSVEDIVLWTKVVFVVELDGTLSNVKAEGINHTFNAEAERTIKAIKGKWKPAERDGEPVRVRYNFPIKMKFD